MSGATTSADVVVVGAGPAGLAAAWRAAARGHEVVVLERADHVGGMAASFEVAGVRVDLGSHRLHPSIDPAILADLRDLLGDDLQVRPRHGRIRLMGRWLRFPLSPTDIVRNAPRRFAAGVVRDALTAPLRHPAADTFDEVVRAGLGPTVADGFYGPYIRKLWGVDPTELSGELARRRVSARSSTDLVKRLARAARPRPGSGSGRGRGAGPTGGSGAVLSPGQQFLYPRRGFGQLSERLADAAVAAGATIVLDADVDRVDLTGADDVTIGTSGRNAATTAAFIGDRAGIGERPTGSDRWVAGHLWSTIPIVGLARAATPAAPEAALAAAQRLQHRGLALVYLVLDRPRYTEFDAHYFPGADVLPSRLSEPRNYRVDDDPPAVTVLCAEVACTVGDAIWSATDADLGASVAASLEAQGLPRIDHAEVVVRRLPHVYPVYRPGFEHDLAALIAWVDEQPRLVTFGRQGLFVPDNTHHALAMGWAAADALAPDGTFDRAAWSAASDRFATHVVED